MGMPKKGTRVLDVDGRKYRWKLASGHVREDDDGGMPVRNAGTLTLQEEVDKPGHVLQHELDWHIADTVSPEVVREIIRRALKAGWDPSSRSKFRLFGQKINVDRIMTKISLIREVHDS